MTEAVLQRGTRQPLMPVTANLSKPEGYDIYPYYPIGDGKIRLGIETLVDWMAVQKAVCIDGYVGVDWESIKERIETICAAKGISLRWVDASAFMRSELEIDGLVAPYLGDSDSVWGRKTALTLDAFLDAEAIGGLAPDPAFQLNIVAGIGASYASDVFQLVYFDLPKNELLFRMRGGSAFNLGSHRPIDRMNAYKRFFFVDWEVLNKRKQEVLPRIAAFADTQWPDTLTWMEGGDLYESLLALSGSVFRPRPWFDPGVWGGQWMKQRFAGLGDEENFAWSFELIAPENGIVLESSGILLEVTFDLLMFAAAEQVLGADGYRIFGDFFPIRFDFLDTFDGGNLSIQCHPTVDYIQRTFGERFTQDETYYILDCKEDAKVYLGFHEDIDPAGFREVLQESIREDKPIDVERFVQAFPSRKHALFLIPNGTVHSSGKNNLVLEISATPYIFTFKMYDWLQKDSDGRPRPINIEHGFNNLNFSRKGNVVSEELISRPYIYREGEGYAVVHYPTHPSHYYDVFRFDITNVLTVSTEDKVHVLMLVEGDRVEVEEPGGRKSIFAYAETFIVPAKVGRYTLKNLGRGEAKVIRAALK